MKKKIGVFIPATLGMLTAFGPFVTDFYLPVLPEMSEFFHTSPALASLSLTTGMIGLAIGQVFIGPLTDKFGRKKILVGSMLMFAIASVFCIFAPNIYLFNLMRLFQGLAGAGGIVISKSMSTDMYSGKELANFMAILGSINGIAPVCAPVVGGLMAGVTNWQGVFGLLLGVGIILMFCSARLPETLTPEKRIQKSIIQIYANLFRVFRNRLFTLSTLAEMSCFFHLLRLHQFIAIHPAADLWSVTLPFQSLLCAECPDHRHRSRSWSSVQAYQYSLEMRSHRLYDCCCMPFVLPLRSCESGSGNGILHLSDDQLRTDATRTYRHRS